MAPTRMFFRTFSALSLFAICLAAMLYPAAAQDRAYRYDTIALSGEPLPGTGGVAVDFPFGFDLNSAGELIFVGNWWSGTEDGSGSGLWLWRQGVLTPVALSETPVPGVEGEVFGGISGNSPRLNSAGNIAFITSGSSIATLRQSLYSGTPESMSLVARTGEPAPGAGGLLFETLDSSGLASAGGTGPYFLLLYGPALNNSGDFVFMAHLANCVGCGVPAAREDGLWLNTANGLELLALTGDPAPGTAGSTFAKFMHYSLNDAGQIAFRALLDDTSTSRTEGLWIGTPGNFSLIAKTGDEAPGTGGLSFTAFASEGEFGPALSASGDFLFRAFVNSGDPSNDSGLWLFRNGIIEPVVRAGEPAPGTTGAAFESLEEPQINNNGEVAFRGILPAAPPSNDEGIWLGTAEAPNLAVRADDEAPGTSGQLFAGFSGLGLNASGEIAFAAQVDPLYYELGVWSSDGTNMTPVVYPGQTLEVRPGDFRTVRSALFFGNLNKEGGLVTSFNDSGQIMVTVDFDDWTSGLFLVTPLDLTQNVPPIASAGADQTVRITNGVTLDGSASVDWNGDPITFSWSLDGVEIATGATPSVGPFEVGTYSIVLTVTDTDGASGTDSMVLTVLPPNQAPVADAGPDQTVTDGESVFLTGSGSFDPDGSLVSYAWSLDGVQFATGTNATVGPFAAGARTVTLTVTDAEGASGSDTMIVFVHQPPVADAGPDQVIREMETATLDGSASSDPEGGPLAYRWTLDGAEIATGPVATVGPFEVGLRVFVLAVTDQEGVTTSDSVTVAVAPADQEPVEVPGAIRVPLDQPTIQDAIDVAVNGDTILVSPGVYRDNINFIGKAITVTSEFGPLVTIVDGGGLDSVAMFNSDEGPDSVLNGFTLQNGDAWDGGGVLILSSSPTITGNRIVNNTACSGIGIDVNFGSPIIERNTISNNIRTGCTGGIGGGGIAIGGAGSAQILDNVISDNVITGGAGGGITLFAAGTPTLSGNVISGNTVSGISPAARGGGISISNRSDALIVQNVITGNTADEGAGIHWLVPASGRGPLVINNTIVDNQARHGVGSAINADGFDAQALLVNNILAAPAGSALACGNFNDQNPPILMSNNVFSAAGSAYGGLCNELTGIDNISVDPLFVDAADGDYRLQPASPLVDAGDETAPDLPAADFDGNARVFDGDGDGLALVDIGAFEFQDVPVADAGPDQSVTAASEVVLDGSASFDPDGGVLSYLWSLDSAQIASGMKPTVGPFAPGVYTVKLTVTDSLGAKASDTLVLTVTNAPPVADAGLDQSVEGLLIAMLDGSGSSDPDGDVLTYSWSRDGVEIATGARPNVGPFSEGTYIFTLTVTDPAGASSSDNVTLTVVNAPPVADAGPDQTIITSKRRKRVTLNGSASSDVDGTIVSYVWRLNGSVLGNGVSIRPRLRRGTNTIVLTVTDEDGASSSDEVVVTIARGTQVSGGD